MCSKRKGGGGMKSDKRMSNAEFFNSDAYKRANERAIRDYSLRQKQDERFVWKVVGLTVILIFCIIAWNIYAG